jgi:hypothetical protein
MGRYNMKGNVRADYVPTISNTSAPTTAELNAGTALSLWINDDGLTLPADQNMVESSALGQTFLSQVPGSTGGTIELNMKRDAIPASDTAWNLFVAGQLSGYLVVRRGPPSATAWTAAQKVLVYQVTFHLPVPVQTARDTEDSFTVMGGVLTDPVLSGTVA